MSFCAEVVSYHPMVEKLLVQILASSPELRRHLSCWNADRADARKQPSVFVVDTCSLDHELAELCRQLRLRCPGSKFLALLHPDKADDEEMLRLLYIGVDGLLLFDGQLERDLPRAVGAIMKGDLWVPAHVIRAYIKQTNQFLSMQLRPDASLTARENQIFQLMIRRLSNKEIAAALSISERTAKFHVSNVFSKLGVNSRGALLEEVKELEENWTLRPAVSPG